jgi:hypothetical protein
MRELSEVSTCDEWKKFTAKQGLQQEKINKVRIDFINIFFFVHGETKLVTTNIIF